MKKNHLFLIFPILLLVLFVSKAFAWDETTHKIIALIAYDNLKPKTRKMVDKLTLSAYPLTANNANNIQSPDPKGRFTYGAIWPDLLRGDDVTATNSWHYIDLPWSSDHKTPTKFANSQNVVWAIGQGEKVLSSKKATIYEKAIFLRYVEHFVGDIHQPLHAINRFDAEHPDGDMGGNDFPITFEYANNLHAYWDIVMGCLDDVPHNIPAYCTVSSKNNVYKIAKKLEKLYPKEYFATHSILGIKMSPYDAPCPASYYKWAKDESYVLAKNFAYPSIKEGARPSDAYAKKALNISLARITLAGYRLANLLNEKLRLSSSYPFPKLRTLKRRKKFSKKIHHKKIYYRL